MDTTAHKADPTENLKRQPKKGILKQSASFEVEGQKSCCKSRPSGSKAMKFDEINILETLHPPGKDYGHMKIDEPNTPYEKSLPDETDSVDPDELTKRLEMGQGQAPKVLQTSSSSEEEEEEDNEENREKRKAFLTKRKAHYNEFLAAKQALQALHDDDEDEEE
ncbi:Protein phosphatase inhibitor [Nesidiocoris tenuis]|nr:Protein phosphatase inhibitor [Nesidiocoris tenuis]